MHKIFKILCVLFIIISITHASAQRNNHLHNFESTAVSENYKLKLLSSIKSNEISFILFSLNNSTRLFLKTDGKVVFYFGDDSKIKIKLKNSKGILKANIEQWDAQNNKCIVSLDINNKRYVYATPQI